MQSAHAESYIKDARLLIREIDRGVQPRRIVEGHSESNFDVMREFHWHQKKRLSVGPMARCARI
jgi:hypothetical protein